MEIYNNEEASFNPILELRGDYSMLDLDNINEMLAPPALDHQLCSLPPTIATPSRTLQQSEALEHSSFRYGLFPCAGGCNLSSSGDQSEAASQGSSAEEDYRHSSTTTTWTSARGGGGGFQISFDSPPERRKNKPRTEKEPSSSSSSLSSNIDFRLEKNGYEPDVEAIAQMKGMIYRAAAMRPVLSEEPTRPKRRNVRISSDPQTVAARHRRERIGDRLRVLQKLVPGGTKMDTASMLDEAANYLKFLKSQVAALETFQPPPLFHHLV